ncbi:hypothetical protein CC2G_013214 [Coprinopsis cinerea AmutBmut pab1-1]|nr:hypothetical protein CC2G_013214 [Coprinopsis cinerea AmutBmut pab1-1]
MFSRIRCARALPRSLVRSYSEKKFNQRLVDIMENGQNWLLSWAIYDVHASSKLPLGFDRLLKALRYQRSPFIWKALSDASPREVIENPAALCQLVSRAVANNNLELALQYLHTLRSKKHPVNWETVAPLVYLAASRNEARLAIDIAVWFEEHSGVKLGKRVWLECLIASAFIRYVRAFRCFIWMSALIAAIG